MPKRKKDLPSLSMTPSFYREDTMRPTLRRDPIERYRFSGSGALGAVLTLFGVAAAGAAAWLFLLR
jgi:hypothetical protein